MGQSSQVLVMQGLNKLLLEVWQKGKDAIEERIKSIEEHFALHSVDLQRPYLNPSSDDIYYPLN